MDGVPETAPRPPARRGTTAIVVVTVLVVVAVLGVLAYRRVASQSVARAEVTRARNLIAGVDAVVRRVDELVRAQAKPGISDEVEEVRDDLPGAKRDAGDAARLLEDAAPRLSEDERRRTIEAADAARTRESLLDAAGPIMEATGKASSAIGPAEDGWDALLSSERKADEAVRLYNRHSESDVRESEDVVADAIADAKRAQTMFKQAAAAMPEADFEPYLEHVQARLDLLALAEDANEAFLDGRIAEANTLSDRYNERERVLVEAAEDLPDSPSVPINDAYERIAGGATEVYFELREELARS